MGDLDVHILTMQNKLDSLTAESITSTASVETSIPPRVPDTISSVRYKADVIEESASLKSGATMSGRQEISNDGKSMTRTLNADK